MKKNKRPDRGKYFRNTIISVALSVIGLFSCSTLNGLITTKSAIPFEERVKQLDKEFQKGFILIPDLGEDYSSPLYHNSVKKMKELGAEWVSIYARSYLEGVDSTQIYADPKITPSDSSLESIIRYIHNVGMYVTLEPVLSIKKAYNGNWLGTIKPKDWNVWFENYNKFIEHYAKLAQKNEAEQFIIGAELNSAHLYKEKWGQVIDNVKESYKGLVSFVSNFDVYETVPFWDKLDTISMNFYFPLNRRDNWYLPWSEIKFNYKSPSFEDLINGWKLWVDKLDGWQKKQGKPILIAEAGYSSQKGTTYQPWAFELGESDFEEQYLAYKSLYQVWSKKQIRSDGFNDGNYIKGIYFYNWGNQKKENDRSFIPSDSAKEVIRTWFKSQGSAHD